MQTYLHLLTSFKRFGRYTQTVRYTLRELKFQGTKIPRSESSIELSFPGAKWPGSERSRERKFQGARRPGSERARERKGQGAKVPGNELARVLLADSLRGANWPGSEKARYHCFALFYFVINACISQVITTLTRYFLISKSRELVSHNPGISALKNEIAIPTHD